jgi:hypothetical protein
MSCRERGVTSVAWSCDDGGVVTANHVFSHSRNAASTTNGMLFAGVDPHNQTITVAVLDASRKTWRRQRFANTQAVTVAKFFRSLGPFELTVEATDSYEWFVDLIEPLAKRVVFAHPGKLRMIAESRRKSDNLDAKVLAEILSLDQIPPACRPTPRTREHRLYVRHRVFLQRKITSVRNKLRRLLSNHNHNLDRKDLFTFEGQAFHASLKLPAADGFCVDQLVAQWDTLRLQLTQADAQLARFAATGSTQEFADRQRLRSIPGVGVVAGGGRFWSPPGIATTNNWGLPLVDPSHPPPLPPADRYRQRPFRDGCRRYAYTARKIMRRRICSGGIVTAG